LYTRFIEIFGKLCTVITRTAKKWNSLTVYEVLELIRYTEITVMHHRRGKWHKNENTPILSLPNMGILFQAFK